jgi:dihydroorotase
MQRRDFVKWTAASAAGLMVASRGWAEPVPDLVLRDVQALMGGAFSRCDLSIRDGRIAEIAAPGSLAAAGQTISGRDLHVSPGWVDLHVHYVDWRHGKSAGSPISRLGAAHGVSALVDAGTTGVRNYHLLESAVGPNPEVPCFALLNVVGGGIEITKFYRTREGWTDLPAMEKLIAGGNHRIVGLKVRADHQVAPRSDRLHYVKKLREAGDLLHLPGMAHIGGPPPHLTEMLPYLKEGDIVTHFLRGQGNSIMDQNGRIHGAVRDAQARGVKFDVGRGMASFAFDTAERALEQGFLDFTISSDLYVLSKSAAKTFANVLTEFLALGLPLAAIMERASTRPAKFLRLEREIRPGAEASLTVFSLAEGEFTCKDVTGDIRRTSRRIIPEWSILQGKPVRAGDLDRKLFLS